jgi:proline iminopeptidase
LPSFTHQGLTLTYEADGDPGATPILLIMGLGMQLTSWPASLVAQLVERGYYVIRIDNRDAGLSSKLEHHGSPNLVWAFLKSKMGLKIRSPYSLHDMAGDALALLDHLGLATAHVVGASMGGMIAQVLTAEQPKRVISLTSIMSSSGRRGLPGPTREAARILMSRPANPRDPEQVANHYVRLFRIIGSPAYPTSEAVLRERIRAGAERNSNASGTARQMLAIAASGSRVRLLQRISRPTLVIHGDADSLVPLPCGQDTARNVPGALLRVIAGMGHDLPEALMQPMARMIDAHCRGQAVPQLDDILQNR